MTGARIRFATPSGDAGAVQAIYAPFCENSPVSFETAPPTVDEMHGRMAKVLERLPWLVCVSDDAIAGFAYASPHRERSAYQWSVDVAVYIHDGFRRRGVGRALYTALFALLRRQGYYNVYAGITLPNPGSVGLHRSFNFQPVGVYENVGFKCGEWQDVGWWALALQAPSPHPAPPKGYAELPPHQRDEAIRFGEAALRRDRPGE